jgi:hypothetical protein
MYWFNNPMKKRELAGDLERIKSAMKLAEELRTKVEAGFFSLVCPDNNSLSNDQIKDSVKRGVEDGLLGATLSVDYVMERIGAMVIYDEAYMAKTPREK